MRRRFFYKREVVEDAPSVDEISFDYNDYMTIEALGECEIICSRKVVYGVNGRGWLYASRYSPSLYSINATKGDFISIKDALSPGESFGNIKVSGPFNLRGNCLSLIFYDDARNNVNIGLYPKVFKDTFKDSPVVFIEESFIPATTLADHCYAGMFYGCTSLTTAPELPATNLDIYCYRSMFEDCISLTSAPALPATTLTDSCYYRMFEGCTSLTTAPALPATTLADSCYDEMFEDCISLTSAPALPATTLADSCYRRMFYSCKKLSYIKMLARNLGIVDVNLGNWVYGVSTTGTFVKNKNATWYVNGVNGVPAGWTVITE